MKPRFPDFMLVGAAKSGTTSLHHYLNEHPEVFMTIPKEPMFFAFAGDDSAKAIWDEPVINLREYQELFRRAKEGQKCGEASVRYLFLYARTIKNIKKFLPDWKNLKIVIILRNPIDRAYSDYTMMKLRYTEPLSFKEALASGSKRRKDGEGFFYDYINGGMYYNQVKAYLDNFQDTRLYLFEDLTENPKDLIKDLYRFIGVSDSFVPELSKKHNISGTPRRPMVYEFFCRLQNFITEDSPYKKFTRPVTRFLIPDRKKRLKFYKKALETVEKAKEKDLRKEPMDPQTRSYLAKLYREDVLNLQDLIKRDLTSWLT